MDEATNSKNVLFRISFQFQFKMKKYLDLFWIICLNATYVFLFRLKNKLVNLKVKLSRNDISSWHHCSECDVFLPTQKTFRKHDHSNGSKEIGRGHNGSEKVVRSRNEPNDVVRINLVRAGFNFINVLRTAFTLEDS